MSDAAKTLPATQSAGNPYVTFGMTGGNDGTPLRFTREGTWRTGFGDDIATLAAGSKLVAQMQWLAFAWNKWINQKREDRRIALVGACELPLRRDQLDAFDEDAWETDDEGEPRDPWQQALELPMLNAETGEMFVYSTASEGGKAAIRKLSAAYGRGQSRFPNHNPVVELGAGGYQHRIRSRGYIHTPTLTIVGWEARDNNDQPPQPTVREMLNDEIPF